MDKNAQPLDYIIKCCEQGLVPSIFDVLNAKDELKKLRSNSFEYGIIGWSRINNRGDIYDLRIVYNPHIDENHLIPIYANKQEYIDKYGKLSK